MIVVGGGISGASFAHFAAKQGLRALVLEKEGVAGGSFATRELSDGFWVELGAHTVYSSYAALLGLVENLGLASEIVPREKAPYRMLVDGTVVSPLSRVHLLEGALSVPKLFFGAAKKQGKSVREYYSSVLGGGNYTDVFSHVAAAVLSQNPDDFPADVLFKKRPKNVAYPRSLTLKRGLRSVVEASLTGEGVHLRTGAEVVALSRSGSGYVLTLRDGEELTTDRVCLAAPSSVTTRLLEGVDEEAGRALAEVAPTVRVESLGLAAPGGRVALPPFVFLIAAGEAFTSVVSRDVVPHSTRRGAVFHFRADSLPRAARLARAGEVLGVDPDETEVAETVHVCPRLSVGHGGKIQALDARLKRNPGLFTVGNYFEGLAIEDCVRRARAESERL